MHYSRKTLDHLMRTYDLRLASKDPTEVRQSRQTRRIYTKPALSYLILSTKTHLAQSGFYPFHHRICDPDEGALPLRHASSTTTVRYRLL